MTILDAPDSIAFFCLLSMRGRIKMEIAGIRFRGRPTTAIARDRYNLPKGTSRAKVLEHVESVIEKAKAVREEQVVALYQTNSETPVGSSVGQGD